MTNRAESTLNTAEGTLTEFLLARIAEDEAVAERRNLKRFVHLASHPDPDMLVVTVGRGEAKTVTKDEFRDRFTEPAEPNRRLLAECAAKHLIVDTHPQEVRKPIVDMYDDWCGTCRTPWPCETLRALAAVYSDHEDYREEWKP